MGFDFANAVDQVSIAIEVHHKKDGLIQTETVEHIFRMPNAAELDKYRSQALQIKGRKTKTRVSEAARWLWSKLIIEVKGYDGLEENWKQFFLQDEIAQIHVQAAVDELLEVAVPSGEFEKN